MAHYLLKLYMLKDKEIILCDVDGVVIRGRPKDNQIWFAELEKDVGINPKDLQEKFFSKYWSDIIIGNRDLKECLFEAMPNLQVEEFIKYWFENDSAVDMNFLKLLNKNSKSLFLATNQEKYRTDYIYNNLGLNKYFDDVIYSGEVGFRKDEDGYWEYIKQKFQEYNVEEMLLIDDTEKNVKKAKEHGISGYFYTTFEKAKNEIFI